MTGTGQAEIVLPANLTIREVSPRDGLQIEEPLPTSEKLRLLDALIAAGVSHVEMTAFVSPRAVPAMADAEIVAQYARLHDEVTWSALVVSPNGARRAVAAGIPNLEYVVSASDGHSLANTRRTTAEALSAVGEVASIVHDAGGACEVIIATAWDCPFDGPTEPERTLQVAEYAAEAGADRLCVADTIGTVSPTRAASLIRSVRSRLTALPLGVHLHNTRGQALAAALAAITAGASMLDASAGGLGGCPFAPGASGNLATEELAYMLEEAGVRTGVDLDAMVTAAALAQEIVGHPLESNMLRAGGRARTHTRHASHTTAAPQGEQTSRLPTGRMPPVFRRQGALSRGSPPPRGELP